MARATFVERTPARSRHSWRLAVVLLLITIAVSCTDTERIASPPPPALAIGAGWTPTGWQHTDWESYVRLDEAHFARISERIPGFGGFFFDERGNLVSWLSDLERASELEAFLEPILRSRPTHLRAGWTPDRRVVVRQGEFDFRELAWWNDRLMQVLEGRRDVALWTMIDERRNRIVIGLPRSTYGAARSTLDGIRANLGIPARALETDASTDEEEDLDPLILYTAQQPIDNSCMASTIRGCQRPLRGGFRVARPLDATRMGVCTISVVGRRSGVSGFITNSHCSDVMFGLDNTNYYQPHTGSSEYFVGWEWADPSYYRCGALWWKCRGSDANFVRASVPIEQGRIARPMTYGPRGGLGSRDIDPSNSYFRIVAQASEAILGDVVDVVGDSSGWSWGWVTETCKSSNRSGHFRIRCQDYANYSAQPGDSGGPVFIWYYDDRVKLYGTNNGRQKSSGAGVFSRISRVQGELDGVRVVEGDTGGGGGGGGGGGSCTPGVDEGCMEQ